MSKVRAYKDYSALLLKDGYIKQGMAVLKEGLKYARHHGSIHSRAARMMSRDWQVEKLISQGHIKAAAQFYRHFRLG